MNFYSFFFYKPKNWLLREGEVKVLVTQSYLTLLPHRLQPARLLCPWNSSGKKTGVVGHSLLQGIFLTQGLNLGLLHYRQILYHISQGNIYIS